MCERLDTECSGTGTRKPLCTEKEIQMKLKETRFQGLEEMSRKVGRCVWDGFLGTFDT